jgi:hypothetical protein
MYKCAGSTEVECTKGEGRLPWYVGISYAVTCVVKGNLTHPHAESVSRTASLIYSRLQTYIELAVYWGGRWNWVMGGNFSLSVYFRLFCVRFVSPSVRHMLLRLASVLKRCVRVYSSGWCLRACARCPWNPKLSWSTAMRRSGVSTDHAVNGTVRVGTHL